MGTNRDITQAMPRLRAAWAWLREEYPKRYPADPALVLVEVFRSASVQTAYYAQGRKGLGEVNRLRKLAGLWLIDADENKRIITHKPAGHSKHELSPSHAFDIGFVRDGQMVYDQPKLYDRAARIIREKFHDVTWGADWDSDGRSDDEKFIDRPHFEV